MTHIDCRIFFCALPKIPKLEGVDDEGESERMQASRAAAMRVTENAKGGKLVKMRRSWRCDR